MYVMHAKQQGWAFEPGRFSQHMDTPSVILLLLRLHYDPIAQLSPVG